MQYKFELMVIRERVLIAQGPIFNKLTPATSFNKENPLILKPKPNTVIVFEACRAGTARKDLSQKTGLSDKQVKKALDRLRKNGYLPRPTRKEINNNISLGNLGKLKSEKQTAESSTVWNKIVPLAIRGLLPSEITDIVYPDLNAKQIRNALYRRGNSHL